MGRDWLADAAREDRVRSILSRCNIYLIMTLTASPSSGSRKAPSSTGPRPDRRVTAPLCGRRRPFGPDDISAERRLWRPERPPRTSPRPASPNSFAGHSAQGAAARKCRGPSQTHKIQAPSHSADRGRPGSHQGRLQRARRQPLCGAHKRRPARNQAVAENATSEARPDQYGALLMASATGRAMGDALTVAVVIVLIVGPS